MLDNKKINILTNNEVIKIARGLIVHKNCVIWKLIAIKTATRVTFYKIDWNMTHRVMEGGLMTWNIVE